MVAPVADDGAPAAAPAEDGRRSGPAGPEASARYRAIVLSNTTLGVFIAGINQSIVIISLPAIFRGIHLDPLEPSNIGYLLWLLQGYLVVTAVLVVTFGRIGDLFGRVRMYNAGFAVFTAASIALAAMPFTGTLGASTLIVLRIVQGVGGALLMANSTAILTDAFPPERRGFAIGFNIIAAVAASFIGLIAGGLLADIDWRLVFLVSVPFGLFGTAWAYLKLHDSGIRTQARIDYAGNITFALGLVLVMVGLTYGLEPSGGHSMGWLSPWVDAELVGGIALLALFAVIESKVPDPMFRLPLFRIRSFCGAAVASLLASMGRGGLQFMLILWLQGIWLPLHGYSYSSTPLWAGIYLVPMSVGFLSSGPISGRLSDRYGQRWFSTSGMVAAAVTYVLLLALPVNFPYPVFAVLILVNGLGVGMFAAPNTTTMMNSVPPADRGAASGMRATSMNSGFVLSIGIFFSLMIVGLSSGLPAALQHGLLAQGVPGGTAGRVAGLPAVATLFAAFLGVNPLRQLLGPHVLGQASVHAQVITGKSFFPSIIAGPFRHGLAIAFGVSAGLCALAAAFSWWAGDCRPADEERADALAHESFVEGHSTAPIDGLEGALPDVVEV